MPWKHFKVEGGWKVWKIDDEGNKVGEPLSKKPMAEAAAKNQVRALYANEKPKKEAESGAGEAEVTVTVTGSEANTISDAPQTGTTSNTTIVANAETKETKMMMDDEVMYSPMGGACTWEEMEAAEQVQETAEHMNDMTWKFRRMADNIISNPMIEDKAQALADLANGYAERVKKPMMHEEMDKELSGEQPSPTFISRLKSWLGLEQSNEDDSDDRSDELKAVWTGKYIGSLPNSSFLYVEPDCETKGCRHFPYKDANGKVDLSHLRNAIARIPQSNAPGLTPEKKTQLQNRARKILADAQGNKDLFIWKEGETYRWLTAYSNNRRDDDTPPEIISSESHKEFDQALHNKQWPMPELWPWHIPFPAGVATFHAYDEEKGFPIAGGYFYKGMEWVAEGMLEASWDGTSHGMPLEWIQRDKEDPTIIIRHRTKEISPLPTWAAANKLAFMLISKETTMADEKGLPAQKREEFVKAFGEERVQQIEAALTDKAKEADEAGIEKKETEQEPAPELTPDDPVVKALAMVVEQLTALDTRLKAIEEKQTEETQAKEQPFDLISFLQQKSAVGKPENKIDGRSKEGKDAPEETKQPSYTETVGGMRVSIADQFIQANQAWYNQTGGTN